MIKLEDVSKSYGSIKVIEDFNFTAEKGKCTCIVGRSGCGKSTVLKLIALITKPDYGKIILNDGDVSLLSDADRDRLRKYQISYSFQEPLLLPYMTALENLIDVVGSKKEECAEILSKLGLSGRLTHRPSRLSVGEKKRVDLARAVIRGCPILIADEPLSNLDPSTSLQVISLLKDHAKMGGTVVYSSVEPSDGSFADEVINM